MRKLICVILNHSVCGNLLTTVIGNKYTLQIQFISCYVGDTQDCKDEQDVVLALKETYLLRGRGQEHL